MDQPAESEESRRHKLETERDLLLKFLASDEYKAVQKVNQNSIDENVQAIVDTRVDSLGAFFKLTDIISDTRTKLNFRDQFTERLSDIESQLNPKKKNQ